MDQNTPPAKKLSINLGPKRDLRAWSAELNASHQKTPNLKRKSVLKPIQNRDDHDKTTAKLETQTKVRENFDSNAIQLNSEAPKFGGIPFPKIEIPVQNEAPVMPVAMQLPIEFKPMKLEVDKSAINIDQKPIKTNPFQPTIGSNIDLNAQGAPNLVHGAASLLLIQKSNNTPEMPVAGTSLNQAAVQKPTKKPMNRAQKITDQKLKTLHEQMARKGVKSNIADIAKEIHVDDDKAEDQMAVVETYADYKPAKLDFGEAHPDPVVETASLSSVEPVDITYKLCIPKKIIKTGALSALQLESIVYASQAHQHFLGNGHRAGFLIGDGAGVGKGRTVAGVIFENFRLGRTKAIWISVSNDLKYDAERDLEDIGAIEIDVHHLNKFKYSKIDSAQNNRVKNGVIFSTYSSLISGSSTGSANFNTRLKQLVNWCGKDFDGCIVFDECHKAKHLIPTGGTKPTKTGISVLELQNQLPKARVVYASATGASEPRNMAYMVRLGLWGEETPFRTFVEFQQTVERRGVGAMEIVAMDMKLRGMYIARQLSFKGVTFTIDEVPFSNEFKQMYNDSVDLWVQAKKHFEEAEMILGNKTAAKKTMWAQFWGAHQRFFKYLCIAAKVSHTVKLAKEAVENGKCAVIGLQSTGEARTLDVLDRCEDGELTEFISTAKSVFENLVEKQFPAPDSRFLDRIDNNNAPKGKSPSPVKNRNAQNLKRKVLASLRMRPNAKIPRVVYSSDSEEEKIKVDNNDSDTSEDEDFAAPVKKGRSSSSESSSDSSSNNDDSDFDTPDESDDESVVDFDNLDDEAEEEESDSDISMEEMVRGRRALATAGPKTMQEKVHAAIMEQISQSNLPGRNFQAGLKMIQAYCNRACALKEELLLNIEKLGKRLPANTLDQLIAELGGSEVVAEMTGRKGRVVQTEDDEIQYESRAEQGISLENLNLLEKSRFMDGDKLIAIISEAASNGISLQSDRRAKNQRRRVHITLELPWSADRAIQQFGRTHRSNQVNAPEYIFLISDLAGERRFASSVSKRLESLGALTHADRRATETRNLSQFNVDNKYGREALQVVLDKMIGYDKSVMETDDDQKLYQEIQMALNGVGIEEPISKVDMSRFLNRILGMPVALQNFVFNYFTETLDEIIGRAKREGKFDLGIMDLGNTQKAEKIKSVHLVRKHATGEAPIDVTTVALERGISWEEIVKKSSQISNDYEGFYLTRHQVYNKRSVFLALMVDGGKTNDELKHTKIFDITFRTFAPHTGAQARQVPMDELMRKGVKATLEQAQRYWEAHHNHSRHGCHHEYWFNRCVHKIAGFECDNGMRRRKHTVLSGSIFAVWSRVENQLRSQQNVMRVIRLKTIDDCKIVGVLLPQENVDDIVEDLSEDSISIKETIFLDN